MREVVAWVEVVEEEDQGERESSSSGSSTARTR